jgi:23S rRNA pseudouridine1911/1915/1917 synthase
VHAKLSTLPIPEARGHTLEVRAETTSERLDLFLSQLPDVGTRSHAQRLIKQGLVTVNGSPRKAAQPVHPDDIVTAFIPRESPSPRPEDLPLTVLYEDADVLVIDKPAGIVVHPAPGHSEHTLVNALLGRYPSLDCGDVMRPGIVHRLDKDTSGIMVIALRPEARDWLIAQFKGGEVHKTYLALVVGQVENQGTIEGAIGRHPIHRKRMALVATGKPARTDYSVVERLGAYTLVEARPVTGRTHQLRVHFASIGHPVTGDRVYGNHAAWRSLDPTLQRHFLHATSLSFRMPHATTERRFTSPLPLDLRTALELARRLAGGTPCPPQPDML